MDNPYEWLRSVIDQVPDLLQPLIIAAASAIPYVEGEGGAVFGILAGVPPIIAAIAAASGNILCVLFVILLGSRVRERIVSRRDASNAPRADPTPTTVASTDSVESVATPIKPTHREKGHQKLRRWMVKFGVPGASLLAPLALPTMLTAAFLVGSGVPKQWVILWQVVAVVLWTTLAAVSAAGALAVLGW